MTSMWILIIVIATSGGVTSTTIEGFPSKSSCERAIATIRSDALPTISSAHGACIEMPMTEG